MTTNQSITRTVIVFAALTVAGVSMTASALLVPGTFAQIIMVAIGSAIFGTGLAFFLVRMFALTEK